MQPLRRHRPESRLRYGVRPQRVRAVAGVAYEPPSFDPAARQLLHTMRWREPPRERPYVVAGLLVTLLLNLLFTVALVEGMHPPPFAYDVAAGTVQVQIITPTEAIPEPPEPEVPIAKPRVRVPTRLPQAKIAPPPPATSIDRGDAMSGRIGSEAPTPQVQLFNLDGSVRLPKAGAPERPATPTEEGKAAWADLAQRGNNPINCKKTRFGNAFAPDESAGDEVARKYLGWIGMRDAEVIAHNARQRKGACD